MFVWENRLYNMSAATDLNRPVTGLAATRRALNEGVAPVVLRLGSRNPRLPLWSPLSPLQRNGGSDYGCQSREKELTAGRSGRSRGRSEGHSWRLDLTPRRAQEKEEVMTVPDCSLVNKCQHMVSRRSGRLLFAKGSAFDFKQLRARRHREGLSNRMPYRKVDEEEVVEMRSMDKHRRLPAGSPTSAHLPLVCEANFVWRQMHTGNKDLTAASSSSSCPASLCQALYYDSTRNGTAMAVPQADHIVTSSYPSQESFSASRGVGATNLQKPLEPSSVSHSALQCSVESYFTTLSLILISAFCMFTSALFHICCCSSDTGCRSTCLKLDIAGITLLIAFSFRSGIYYGFAHLPFYRTIYLYQCYVIAAILLPLPFMSSLHIPALWKYVPAVFTTSTFTGVVPIVHYFATSCLDHMWRFGRYLVIMTSLYVFGLCFYLTKFPEKYRPGKFDIWGHSHQWWHLFVFGAAAIWVEGCIRVYYFSCGAQG